MSPLSLVLLARESGGNTEHCDGVNHHKFIEFDELDLSEIIVLLVNNRVSFE